MNLTLFITLFTTYVIALTAIMRDYDKSSKKKKLIDWIAASAVTILTIVNGYSQFESLKEQESQKAQIGNLYFENEKMQSDLKNATDSLQTTIDELQTQSFLTQAVGIKSKTEFNKSLTLQEDFCYLTIVPNGDGSISFAINNPFQVTIPNVSFIVLGYDSIKKMRYREVSGYKTYKADEFKRNIIYQKMNINVKPGTTIFTEFHQRIGKADFASGNIAAFEITFFGPTYRYVEQLGGLLSEDHFSSLLAYRLYKIGVDGKDLTSVELKRSVPRAFPGDWEQIFDVPVARSYEK